MNEGAPPPSTSLASVSSLYVLFLYGPMGSSSSFFLSKGRPAASLPARRGSLHGFERLWQGGGIVDIYGAFNASLKLGLLVMVLTGWCSRCMAGLAFRKRFFGFGRFVLHHHRGLIVPSIVTSLGIALEFRVLDDFLRTTGPSG